VIARCLRCRFVKSKHGAGRRASKQIPLIDQIGLNSTADCGPRRMEGLPKGEAICILGKWFSASGKENALFVYFLNSEQS